MDNMNQDEMKRWAEQLAAGDLTVSQFLQRFRPLDSAADQPVTLDLDRARRCGFPEVIFAEGKTADTVRHVAEQLVAAGQPVLATHVSAEQADNLMVSFPRGSYNRMARTFQVAVPGDQHPDSAIGRVVIVTAGTTDLPVAEEARETLNWMNVSVAAIHDVGVAGPHRLVERVNELTGADAAVVVAGMEGALPSIVGGYVACPIIAVPTSVGYGANLAGLSALLGMLNSCAANVAVVNIDAGFKGGYLAGMIAHGRNRGGQD